MTRAAASSDPPADPPAGLAPRALGASDLPALAALVAEAGWNQVDADWHWMLAQGDGIGLAVPDGRVVASAVALPYQPAPGRVAFGWIGMVLVAQAWRRRGAARWLMRDRVDALATRGCMAMLDATPAGQPLYAGMGFAAGPALTRWTRDAGSPPRVRVRFDPLRAADMPEVAALDAEAIGADRSVLLASLRARLPHAAFGVREHGALVGYAFARDGRIATHLGPVVAFESASAVALLTAQADVIDGPLLVDAFDGAAVGDALRALGFSEQRRFTRMALGAPPPRDRRAFAAAGPELG